MKTSSRSSRIKKARTHVTHKKVVRRRPIHKRVLLHPISWFLLLCAGVLVVGSTFRGQAATYDVTAKISAPALTEPAVITQPTDQKRISASVMNVLGTCPDDSYINLYRDGAFSGVDICDNGGHFHIQTGLSPGANELKVRVFNLTDDEGPDSPPITVFYDLPPATPTPVSVPVSLMVSNIEEEKRAQGTTQDVTSRPTVSGLAPPFSEVTVTFYSEPSVCKTEASAKGVWSCTLSNSLPPGIHHVVIDALTPAGKKLTLPTFEVRVVEYVHPFVITSDYKYQAHAEGQSVDWKIAITGGTPPYEVLIDWGDGSTSRQVQSDGSEFKIAHSYDSAEPYVVYNVLVTAVDSRGASTMVQLVAAVQGGPVAAGLSGFSAITDTVRRWLWVVWPAYIAVVLMVISFWIGEREAYQRFVARRRASRPRPHARDR